MSDRCENVPFGNVRAAASEGMDPRCGSRTGLLTICGDCYDTEHDLRDRIAKLEAENARLWSALVKACDDAWTEDPAHMARRYHEEANP